MKVVYHNLYIYIGSKFKHRTQCYKLKVFILFNKNLKFIALSFNIKI